MLQVHNILFSNATFKLISTLLFYWWLIYHNNKYIPLHLLLFHFQNIHVLGYKYNTETEGFIPNKVMIIVD